MGLDPNSCYQALIARDARFDGVFYVGVATTMIYCRPICPARTPRQDRCRFFTAPAAAEKAGYRPCLRCRPELAPGNAPVDARSNLAAAVSSRIDDGALSTLSVDQLAASFGVSARHLRRVVEAEYGVSVIELAQTQRLLLAKKLIAETDLSMAGVALASGFASLRRFNALFRQRYRLTPTELRRGANPGRSDMLSVRISYRAPYDWDSLIDFIGHDTASGVDWVQGGVYERTVAVGKHRGWICVANNASASCLELSLSSSLTPVIASVIGTLKRLFDTASHPHGIVSHLGPLAVDNHGIRVPGAFDGFEMASRSILGQQVSLKAASTMAGRFAQRFGEPIETQRPHLTRLTPTAAAVARASIDEIASLGIVRCRANALRELAKAVDSGALRLDSSQDPEHVMRELVKLPGIGDWTAHSIGMRALRWPDAFPHTDLAIYKVLGTRDPKTVLRTAEVWRPWRAYAAMHLWKRWETMAK